MKGYDVEVAEVRQGGWVFFDGVDVEDLDGQGVGFVEDPAEGDVCVGQGCRYFIYR